MTLSPKSIGAAAMRSWRPLRWHWHEQAAIRAAAMHRRVVAYEAVIKEILETEDHFLKQLKTVEEVACRMEPC